MLCAYENIHIVYAEYKFHSYYVLFIMYALRAYSNVQYSQHIRQTCIQA